MSVDIKRVDIRLAVIPQGRKTPWGDAPWMTTCKEHKDDAESLAVYDDHITCFGCGFVVAKRMEALAYLLKKNDWREALIEAPKYYRCTEQIQATRAVTPPPSEAIVGVYERMLWEEEKARLSWLRDRDLSDQSIRSFRLGHTGASFVIPVYDGQYQLVTLRYRRDDAYGTEWAEYDEDLEIVRHVKRPKYKGMKGRNDAYLYPAWKIENDYRNWVVIVEGELDAIRLQQENIPACTTTNGAGNVAQIVSLLPPRIERIYYAGDMDEAGIRAGKAIEKEALARGLSFEWVSWPREWGKDITEVLQAGHQVLEGVAA